MDRCRASKQNAAGKKLDSRSPVETGSEGKGGGKKSTEEAICRYVPRRREKRTGAARACRSERRGATPPTLLSPSRMPALHHANGIRRISRLLDRARRARRTAEKNPEQSSSPVAAEARVPAVRAADTRRWTSQPRGRVAWGRGGEAKSCARAAGALATVLTAESIPRGFELNCG
jgi:hypothetical protein